MKVREGEGDGRSEEGGGRLGVEGVGRFGTGMIGCVSK